jgi:hypothetical protein
MAVVLRSDDVEIRDYKLQIGPPRGCLDGATWALWVLLSSHLVTISS